MSAISDYVVQSYDGGTATQSIGRHLFCAANGGTYANGGANLGGYIGSSGDYDVAGRSTWWVSATNTAQRAICFD